MLSTYKHKLHDRTYPCIISTRPELTYDSQDEAAGLEYTCSTFPRHVTDDAITIALPYTWSSFKPIDL